MTLALHKTTRLLRRILSEGFIHLGTALGGKGRLLAAVFLPWYLWALTFYPNVILWWPAVALSLMLVSICLLWPRSVLYWLPPCIFLFNTVYFWLPWPSVKLAYIAPSAMCLAVAIRQPWKRDEQGAAPLLSLDFHLFFVCLLAAAFLGVVSQLAPYEPAAWHELKMQLRRAPLANEDELFIPFRYVWIWCLGLSTYYIAARLLRGKKDIHTLFWSMQWSSLAVSVFGIYSYITRSFMVDHYLFERRINSTLSSPAVLADILTVTFILGLYLVRESRSWIARATLSALMVLQLVTIVLSGCRVNAIILALFGVVWLCVHVFRNRRRRWITLATLCALLVAAGLAMRWINFSPEIRARLTHVPVVERLLFWKTSLGHGGTLKGTLLDGRYGHWKCALNMVEESPLWGVGCGLFEQRYAEYRGQSDLFQRARTHNMLLRVCAEAGIVTLLAFLIFLAATGRRLCRGFSARAKTETPEWAGCLQTLTVVFSALLLSSMASDILFVREECIMFVALLAGCATYAYRRLPEPDEDDWMRVRSKWKKLEHRMRRRMRQMGWGYLGEVRLRSVLMLVGIAILLFLVHAGLGKAYLQRQRKLKRCVLSYGFHSRAPGSKRKRGWRSISKRAMNGMVVREPVLHFGYRALNERMAVRGHKLRLYIAGHLTATLNLNSVEERKLYCDVSGLKGKWVSIEWEADRAYVPWREHWFADPHAYGAVITKPQWACNEPSELIASTEGTWSIRWTAHPEFYAEQGYTNAIQSDKTFMVSRTVR